MENQTLTTQESKAIASTMDRVKRIAEIRSNLGALSGRPLDTFTPDERSALEVAYLDYFDTLDARKRAIGYCVILGGIPSVKIGRLNAVLKKDSDNRTSWGVSLDSYMLMPDDGRLMSAIDRYINKDERLSEIIRNLRPGETKTAPLFVAAYHGKYSSLKNCCSIMTNAGKAIGFNATAIRIYMIGDNPMRVLPWAPDDKALAPVAFWDLESATAFLKK